MLRCLRIIRLSSAKDYATKPTVMSRLNNYRTSIGSGLNHEPPIGKTTTNNRLGQACNLKRFFTVTTTLWTRLWPKQFSIHSKAPAEEFVGCTQEVAILDFNTRNCSTGLGEVYDYWVLGPLGGFVKNMRLVLL